MPPDPSVEKNGPSPKRTAIALAALLPAAALLMLLLMRAALDALPEGYVMCPMLRLTGLRCPLCGGTHAALELMRGRLLSALRHNAFAVAVMLWCGWMYLRLLGSCLTLPYRPYRPAFTRLTAAVLIAAAVIFTIVRNMPVYGVY